MSTANPTVMMMKPRPTTCRVPILVASLGTSGARITRPTVAGRVARPAWSALIPSVDGSWK